MEGCKITSRKCLGCRRERRTKIRMGKDRKTVELRGKDPFKALLSIDEPRRCTVALQVVL
jgi:hypothetical protein